MELINKPLFTKIYNVEEFIPIDNSIYLYSTSVEERSEHVLKLIDKKLKVTFLKIDHDENYFLVEDLKIGLRSLQELKEFWTKYDFENIYIDITGIVHQVWAPLIKSLHPFSRKINIIYVEPKIYQYNFTPTEGQIFDLSEKIKGIAPLPSFAYMREVRESESFFIPLLGFEGTRLSYLLEQIQPLKENITPVVGIPGFKPEYPFHTYFGNRVALLQSESWKNIRYAPANCPFCVFYLLDELSTKNHIKNFKIALIGTKPLALGAVLYAIHHPNNVELIYDYPVRKAKRTLGYDRLLEYNISVFCNGR